MMSVGPVGVICSSRFDDDDVVVSSYFNRSAERGPETNCPIVDFFETAEKKDNLSIGSFVRAPLLLWR